MINVAVKEVDAKAFNDAVNNIIATSNRDMKEVVNQQGKLLAIELMNYTPPFAGGKVPKGEASKTTKGDQRQGMEAVKRDILRTMTPPSELFKMGFKNKWLEKVVKSKDDKKIQQYFESVKSPILNKYKVAQFDPQLHLSKRVYSNRFRPKYQYKFVSNEGFVKKYIKEMQGRVGYMKAGWAVAAQFFGATIPKWIEDHLYYAKGEVKILNEDPTNYSIEMANYTPTIDRHASSYNVAIRMRTNALNRAFDNYLEKTLKESFTYAGK